MNRRALTGILKANEPLWIWICLPLWIGPIIMGLDGREPEWGPVVFSLLTVTTVLAIADYANTYADRDEDWLYGPTNPLVTGELEPGTARNALILQNVLAGIMLVALVLLTRNYPLAGTTVLGWFIGMSYSLPPFKLKETLAGPFLFALGVALLPVVAWLIVAPLNSFIVAFAAFLFLHSLGFGVANKFRKTLLALNSGLVRVEEGSGTHGLRMVDFRVDVRTAIAVEAVATLGAFVLIPVFWRLGIFGAAVSIPLLTLPVALTIVALALRVRDPVGNGLRCKLLMTLAWISIAPVLLGVALTSLVHLGLAIMVCLVFVAGFLALLVAIHPFGSKAVADQWQTKPETSAENVEAVSQLRLKSQRRFERIPR